MSPPTGKQRYAPCVAGAARPAARLRAIPRFYAPPAALMFGRDAISLPQSYQECTHMAADGTPELAAIRCGEAIARLRTLRGWTRTQCDALYASLSRRPLALVRNMA
jgi:hypothetical protein